MRLLIQRFPLRARLAAALPLGLVLLVLGAVGCSPNAERESLQAQIALLTSENKLLSEQLRRLEAERSAVAGDLGRVSRELADLTEHTDRLRRINAALQEDARALRSAYENLREEHTKLLLKEPEMKRMPEDPRQAVPPTPAAQESQTERAEIPRPRDTSDAAITPCEALIHFLQDSEAAVRQYKGHERLQKMRVVRAQYSRLMENAPLEAREAAESWLKDLVRVQADPSDPSMYPFLPKRHRLLKACIKEQ